MDHGILVDSGSSYQHPGGESGSADMPQVTGGRRWDPLAPNSNIPTALPLPARGKGKSLRPLEAPSVISITQDAHLPVPKRHTAFRPASRGLHSPEHGGGAAGPSATSHRSFLRRDEDPIDCDMLDPKDAHLSTPSRPLMGRLRMVLLC